MLQLTNLFVKDVSEVVTSDKGYQSKFLIVEDNSNPMYPQVFQIEVRQNMLQRAEGIAKGDTINLQFAMGGREWQNKETLQIKYFTTLYYVAHAIMTKGNGASVSSGYQVQQAPHAQAPIAQAAQQPIVPPPAAAVPPQSLVEDDLPF